jgi:hypothetical protein
MGKMRRMIIGFLIFGAVILLFMPMPWLVIEDVKGGEKLKTIPLTWLDHFEICYTHSVDRQPVCEVFKAKWGKGIILHEMYFRMFGAGMGHWKGHGDVVTEAGWTKIKKIDKPLGKFLLRVGSRGVDHVLSVRGKKINLTESAEGKLMEVRIEIKPWMLAIIKKLRADHD